ncbi:MAG: hypothetical protein DRO12_06610 [Thermoprotei archaeon]|nr:MAG: hypothetical protein DRO12_06610 [Thermoprotei archaeon]
MSSGRNAVRCAILYVKRGFISMHPRCKVIVVLREKRKHVSERTPCTVVRVLTAGLHLSMKTVTWLSLKPKSI